MSTTQTQTATSERVPRASCTEGYASLHSKLLEGVSAPTNLYFPLTAEKRVLKTATSELALPGTLFSLQIAPRTVVAAQVLIELLPVNGAKSLMEGWGTRIDFTDISPSLCAAVLSSTATIFNPARAAVNLPGSCSITDGSRRTADALGDDLQCTILCAMAIKNARDKGVCLLSDLSMSLRNDYESFFPVLGAEESSLLAKLMCGEIATQSGVLSIDYWGNLTVGYNNVHLRKARWQFTVPS